MYHTNKKATTNCIGIEYMQNAFEPEEIEELKNNLNTKQKDEIFCHFFDYF